jgi:ribosome-associated protein
LPQGLDAAATAHLILQSLEDDKAEEIVDIDVTGKSSLADRLIIASGRSQRHVGALADHVMRKLKEAGAKHLRVEGLPHCDWVLVDAGDVIVHLFRPEVRAFYGIERIWTPAGDTGSAAPLAS